MRVAHLDRPFGDWPASVAAVPARLMGLEDRGQLAPGSPADLVLFEGRDWSEVLSRPETARPPLYSVLLLNDDYTPMDFVIDVLMRFFPLNLENATQIMLHVHTRGKGICGVYTREVAESKVTQVNEFSRQHQHPLLCTMEKT